MGITKYQRTVHLSYFPEITVLVMSSARCPDGERRKMSWEELLEEYFLIKNLKPDTEHSYRKVVRLFNEFMGGNSPPGDVTARDIQRWRRHMLKVQGRSTNTRIIGCHISDQFWR